MKITKFLVLTALVTAMLCGCATTSWQDAAGKSLATIAQSVDAGMQGWAKYVVLVNPPQDQQDAVRAMYGQYQSAMATALVAYNAAVSAHDQTLFAQASATLSASQSSLLNLVAQFTQKTT